VPAPELPSNSLLESEVDGEASQLAHSTKEIIPSELRLQEAKSQTSENLLTEIVEEPPLAVWKDKVITQKKPSKNKKPKKTAKVLAGEEPLKVEPKIYKNRRSSEQYQKPIEIREEQL